MPTCYAAVAWPFELKNGTPVTHVLEIVRSDFGSLRFFVFELGDRIYGTDRRARPKMRPVIRQPHNIYLMVFVLFNVGYSVNLSTA